MKKKLLIVMLAAMSLVVTACGKTATTDSQSQEEVTGPIEGTFDIHVQADDWGCAVDKVIINANRELTDISGYEFTITETKEAMSWETFQMEVSSGDRTVVATYLSDEKGNAVDGASNYVTVELAISPFEASPYVTDMMNLGLNKWSDAYSIAVTVAGGEESFTVNGDYANVITSADMYETAVFTSSNGQEMNYATYAPENGADTLVVWLHGLGEGGNDIKSVLVNAEVEALAKDKFQSTVGGAYILAPQSPTYWMDNEGNGANYVNGEIKADGTSVYTESVYELINQYKAEVGASKVVIAGCSNGGYMAMILAMNYGSEFDAYVPICEAMEDSFITDANIKTLKDLNMFFIYAKNDPLVIPEVYEIPTLKRLKAAGAENICVFNPDDVHDTTGRFNDQDGNPFQSYGHASWQYFFNNEAVCDEDGTNCWDWISNQ